MEVVIFEDILKMPVCLDRLKKSIMDIYGSSKNQ